MKKIVQRIVFSCSALLILPLFLIVVSSGASFLAYYVFPSRINVHACTQSYTGVSKGTVWDNGEWHHYVDFRVNNSAPFKRWEVTSAPLPSSIWEKYSTTTSLLRRVWYRWPSNWSDPFPANDWKICAEGS